MLKRSALTVVLMMVACVATALAAEETAPNHRPVAAVGDQRIAVGDADLRLYVSRDWSVPQPGIKRAVLVLHGLLRNADVYFRSALKAQAAAGPAGTATLMIAPQFLAATDVRAHGLPERTLYWSYEGWEGGEPAIGPTPESSFFALDAILLRLGDRRLFPDLTQVVVAGHSGGGQVVQRYAVLGEAEAALRAHGIAVRYVVANPSSYAWFSADRPDEAIANTCPGYDRWKYGMHDLPPYAARQDSAALETRYATRDVVYLLGTLDTNPNHPVLDKSCMAETQGPYRYARGHAFYATLQTRFGAGLHQTLHDVPGVGHDGDKMLTSPCGLGALFDIPGCGP
jgi:pimeloyl-ACP methyl ester carboxylesterase